MVAIQFSGMDVIVVIILDVVIDVVVVAVVVAAVVVVAVVDVVSGCMIFSFDLVDCGIIVHLSSNP